jgi:imidazolonepropionase
MWDRCYIGGHVATLRERDGSYGAIRDAAVGISGSTIVWVGARADLPEPPSRLALEIVPLEGAWMTPGLIDCHTHLVFGGSRGDEFEARLKGESYASIAARGGGIRSTVAATRASSDEELLDSARRRCRAIMAEGATTIEVKSGYGLTVHDELRMLRVARRLGELEPVRIVTTLLGAHAPPPELDDDLDRYVDIVCDEMIPAARAEGLADAVDAFCEGIGFSPAQVERIFDAAGRNGLPVKLHAEQLSLLGGATLAAGANALSADHLEWLDLEGVQAMAASGTVAVLLPGAFHTLRETKLPPVAALREAGVPMALATDCNPGSSPTTALGQMINFGCLLFGLTPEEALAGVTRNAAKALGLGDHIGTIEVGKQADLAVWAMDRPADLAYWTGGGRLREVLFAGRQRLLGAAP